MLQFALTRPAELSRQLRLDSGPDMQRRRWLVGLSFVGVGAGMIVSLFQTGMIRRLPDFPFWPFDATKVDAQPYAYSRLQTPDALLMVTSYALTALLAGAGGRNRAKTLPLLPLALAAKTGFDLFTRSGWDVRNGEMRGLFAAIARRLPSLPPPPCCWRCLRRSMQGGA